MLGSQKAKEIQIGQAKSEGNTRQKKRADKLPLFWFHTNGRVELRAREIKRITTTNPTKRPMIKRKGKSALKEAFVVGALAGIVVGAKLALNCCVFSGAMCGVCMLLFDFAFASAFT